MSIIHYLKPIENEASEVTITSHIWNNATDSNGTNTNHIDQYKSKQSTLCLHFPVLDMSSVNKSDVVLVKFIFDMVYKLTNCFFGNQRIFCRFSKLRWQRCVQTFNGRYFPLVFTLNICGTLKLLLILLLMRTF